MVLGSWPTIAAASEQNILNAIYHYLLLDKNICMAHVRNSGNIVHRDGEIKFLRPKFGQKGVADLLGCVYGIPMAIEVKTSKGQLSEFQKEWLGKWSQAGGQAMIARSLDDVIKKIEEIKRAARSNK